MNPYRLRLYTACVRSELLARGTPCPALALDDDGVRAQLHEWLALLALRTQTQVTIAPTLVLPPKDAGR